eukprot:CAMPEP_0180489814 /NCGR_PEP_ID=MMETSP1036_2-20121128/38787_1 /TAXON_ID=632150 /ORGANISM="Azadinium spinosum, Strain 3D9" /LENGTH=133 /DNA_ID=CAMNT_0022497975 /DNA_START=103 /DNA_END=504 /DNA_ORIENTATION=-
MMASMGKQQMSVTICTARTHSGSQLHSGSASSLHSGLASSLHSGPASLHSGPASSSSVASARFAAVWFAADAVSETLLNSSASARALSSALATGSVCAPAETHGGPQPYFQLIAEHPPPQHTANAKHAIPTKR